MEKQKVVGIFRTEDDAIQAIKQLQQQGYSSEDISVIAREKEEVRAVAKETGTHAADGAAAGMATGGILGGVGGLLVGLGALAIPGVGPIVAAGPLAAALGGAAVGAGAGGLVGALVGMGIPKDQAEEYEDYVQQGDILVLVEAETDRRANVYDTFRTYKTRNAHHYDDRLNDQPPIV
ncbi:general stress protein [Fictibacillus aquaticus]|uniref:Low temperature-induced protein n=1 Tax=Fictibacillus aquaticus TaxID=2021314 RepID=A0A235F4V8_9BACL|nr:general stress protein [Fictibacillus aquaticus]OYD56301.1 low temperature-induced protein [Fictibacillus aquaticus]